MATVYKFTSDDCLTCDTVNKLFDDELDELEDSIDLIEVCCSTPDGLALACYMDVHVFPTYILEDEKARISGLCSKATIRDFLDLCIKEQSCH